MGNCYRSLAGRPDHHRHLSLQRRDSVVFTQLIPSCCPWRPWLDRQGFYFCLSCHLSHPNRCQDPSHPRSLRLYFSPFKTHLGSSFDLSFCPLNRQSRHRSHHLFCHHPFLVALKRKDSRAHQGQFRFRQPSSRQP